MDDNADKGIPPEETVTEGPATPDPPRPPTIEAFVGYRDRLAVDTDGRIGEMMLSYANAQPEEIREKLENDIDVFTQTWDKFASAFPPRPTPSPPPQAPPPPPREYRAPAWQAAQWEKEARRTNPVLGPYSTLPPSVAEWEGASERRAAATYSRELNEIRQRARGGDREAEYLLASKLFPNGLGKPNHGPENY